MAFEIPGRMDGTRPAGADLSAAANQHKFVKLNSSGQVVLCSAATDKPYGVLQNRPAAGQAAAVMIDGISKVQADANLTVGDKVGTSADGQAAAYVPGTDTTKYIVGEVLTDNGAAGELVSIQFDCAGASRGA
jgi:hypothetical protein